MTNLEFYKEEIKDDLTMNLNNYSQALSVCTSLIECHKKHSDIKGASSLHELIDWLCEEHQILDKEEKEYLSAVIRPFRDREDVIITIEKNSICGGENLEIRIKREFDFDTTLFFPPFENGTMYKGMEVGKKYTLKELGL